MSNDIVQRVTQALKRFYPDYYQRFHQPSMTGEYYGRGQLEGLAVGLWVALDGDLSMIDNPEWHAYLDVWGGDRWKENDEIN